MGLKLAEVARFRMIVKRIGAPVVMMRARKTGADDWRRRRTRNMAGSICKHAHKTGTWLKYSTANMPERTKT